jgi:hypothetical protein
MASRHLTNPARFFQRPQAQRAYTNLKVKSTSTCLEGARHESGPGEAFLFLVAENPGRRSEASLSWFSGALPSPNFLGIGGSGEAGWFRPHVKSSTTKHEPPIPLVKRRIGIVDGKPYELVPGAALQAPFKTNGPAGWSDLKREHPDSVGWIELSAVGLNHDKTVAIVYVGHHCGGLCGGGGFRVLHKAEGRG